MALKTTLYSDPGCPWAYSENPALAVLRWRYADALEWRFVAVGLADGRGVAVKIADGYPRAKAVVLAAVLRRLGVDAPGALDDLASAPVLGHDDPVGGIVAVGF